MDNRLARAKVNIDSLDASRILANLIACINIYDTDFDQSYCVAARDCLNIDGGGSYTRVKNLCRELIKATVEVEVEKPDAVDCTKHPVFETYTFFRFIRYKNGIIEASFNSSLKSVLLQLYKCFTQYNLIEYLQLPSIYSQRLFEILQSWKNVPHVTISIKELHRMLNTPNSLQNNYKDFRLRVLEKAHKDITGKTSLRYEWQPIRVGKSVEKIIFYFGTRRKIENEAKEKDRREKMQRIINSRYVRAVMCAKTKKGVCTVRDNRPIICKMCVNHGILQDIPKLMGV